MKRVPLGLVIYFSLLLVGIIAIITALTFPKALSQYDIGPAGFPITIAITMIALIVLDAFFSFNTKSDVKLDEIVLAFLFLLAMISFVQLANYLGFFYSLPFASFIGLRALGSRAYIINLIYSIMITAIFWGLFEKILLIPLSSF